MKLSEWLEQNKVRRNEFAERIGVTPQTITGWCDGSFWITKDKAQRVFDETDGCVTPTDFMQTERAAQ
ncbi:MAG: helix-turn-helix transcriptional regulator [Pyrinomonadaceae bacterium]|nr:helix-turn-helix transcriptional regulator [Pyrinomonadaceae bacterium]